ncbi:MAG: glucosaminidase domain-containing protein [Alphaproteobacteria bacterium]|nr:glucosaminidase domain-containing protein [Alphaproteobacteria bacterium]
MKTRLIRAVDLGRNHVLLGILAACLFGTWLVPPVPSRDAVTPVRTQADSLAAAWAQAVSPVPLPQEPPPVALTLAMLQQPEVNIAELPMPELPSGDPALAEPGEGSGTAANEPPVLHGRLSYAIEPLRRPIIAVRAAGTGELSRIFEAHDYVLDQARRGEPVPALQIDRVPDDIVNVRDGNERKELFIKALLPIVLETNERILAERQHLLRLRDRSGAGRGLSVIERMWLAEVADRYGLDPTDLDELLRRVDVVPPSMAIAQAGVESGWGTSYAARVGNSLFGQIQVVGRHSVSVPWQPGRAMPQPFSSVAESVEAYFMNLNTHFAYADFRTERARVRAEGRDPDGYHLIGQLLRYSELGQSYVNFVRNVIRENRLSDFDQAKLPPI